MKQCHVIIIFFPNINPRLATISVHLAAATTIIRACNSPEQRLFEQQRQLPPHNNASTHLQWCRRSPRKTSMATLTTFHSRVQSHYEPMRCHQRDQTSVAITIKHHQFGETTALNLHAKNSWQCLHLRLHHSCTIDMCDAPAVYTHHRNQFRLPPIQIHHGSINVQDAAPQLPPCSFITKLVPPSMNNQIQATTVASFPRTVKHNKTLREERESFI